MALAEIWQQTLDVLNAPITKIDEEILTPLGVIQIVIILGLTLLALVPARRILRRSLSERLNVDERSTVWIVRLTTWLVVLVGIYVALTSVGFNLNVLLAIIGGLSVGIAFGTQDIARNLISGVIGSAERRIGVGAEIEIRGFRGHVEEVGPRSVRLRLPDGRRVLLASVDFMAQPVALHGAPTETDDAEQSE